MVYTRIKCTKGRFCSKTWLYVFVHLALIAKSKQKASKKDISEYQPKVYKQF